jgi:hypothetical protein
MITEQICIDIVRTLYAQTSTMTLTLSPDDSPDAKPKRTTRPVEHGLPPRRVYLQLLPRYALTDLDTAVRWLELGEYIGYTGWGIAAPRQVMYLTERGLRLVTAGRLDDTERGLVYQEDPYAAFVARQFRIEDASFFEHLRDRVLRPIGIEALDGQVDGIEAFRGEILRKIRIARYFICVLTHRCQLIGGTFASSVWLYQETGAAVAMGKKPLILVEDNMDEHFAGELQKNYEYVPFRRSDFEVAFDEVGRRLRNDLQANHIPLRVGC